MVMDETERQRLPLRTSADTEGDVQRVLSKIEATGQNLKILRALANSPSAFRPFVLLANGLLRSSPFPAVSREVVILHLAARRGTTYEWEEHVPMAATAGVTPAQVEALARLQPLGSELFSESDLLAVQIAEQVIDEHHLDDGLWEAAVGMWGAEAALDLLLTVGWWGAFVPTVIEALGLTSPH
jgi:4-carboxymuconolactone decarboxylase